MPIQIIINPGSGAVKSGKQAQSEKNIKKFIQDVNQELKYEFVEVCENGRHSYRVYNDTINKIVDMPAIPLSKVRFLGNPNQNIWDFPRLYVDGSSWVWKYALTEF